METDAIDPTRPRVLVTGASGFIGQALCRLLPAEDWDTRVLLRDAHRSDCLPAELQADVIVADLNSQTGLLKACADRDIVLHLAGQAHVAAVSAEVEVNPDVRAVTNLVAAASEQKVRRIVLLSSSLAHAAETRQGDITAYGEGKLAVEAELIAAAQKGQLEAVILRAVNVYGVGMKGNIASMISMIIRGSLPPLPLLSNRVSLVGSQDLARAIIQAATSAEAKGKTYTVTDGAAYSISEIESAIYSALGRQMPGWRAPPMILYAASALAGLFSRLGLRKGSISSRTYRNLTMDNLFDNAAICGDLGFNPRDNLYAVLPEIVESLVTPNS